MKILLTGATGYIGKRLLYVLLQKGHEVICCVRDRRRFEYDPVYKGKIEIIEIDFEKTDVSKLETPDFDIAYYLIHSMSSSTKDFYDAEALSARNFVNFIDGSKAKQIIYLSGIINQDELSKHLSSRKNVEEILQSSRVALTVLRAGIIIGSGSASFEIIRDLVEKLPVMITPKWLNTKSQPIAVKNVIEFLTGVIMVTETFHKAFDIGGPEILTYKQMLLKYAKVRKLKRFIFTVPVMTPRISSYWLYFVTSTSYKLAVNLVDSMKIEVIARDNHLADLLNIELITYEKAVELAFEKIEQNSVISSWKDALISSTGNNTMLNHIQVPKQGCFIDSKSILIREDELERILDRIWQIGGDQGWYYANFLWTFRGFIDKLFGGVGLNRGRTNKDQINIGDAIDFWRVLVADKKRMRLLLFAEMKLPGDAWLEFEIKNKDGKVRLFQTATFRPKGINGRLYWYLSWPFHFFVFRGMLKKIAQKK